MPRMNARIGLRTIASVALLAASAAVFAQDQLYRSVNAVTGKVLRIGFYANVSKDCVAGPLPEVKVVAPPKHGSLAVQGGKVKPGTLARCPNLEVPVQSVLYQSNPRYAGADEVAYEVKHSDGRVQRLNFRIAVGATPQPRNKPETTEL
jgi:hypothetical protein